MQVHELYPYLCVRGAAAASDYYQRAFGAKEKCRLAEPSGRIGHLEVEIGRFVIMIADEFPEMGIVSPVTLGGTPFCLHLHVDDCDAWTKRAVEAGGTLISPPKDQFYGERSARVRDPFGHDWLLGHHLQDMPCEEMQAKYTELLESS